MLFYSTRIIVLSLGMVTVGHNVRAASGGAQDFIGVPAQFHCYFTAICDYPNSTDCTRNCLHVSTSAAQNCNTRCLANVTPGSDMQGPHTCFFDCITDAQNNKSSSATSSTTISSTQMISSSTAGSASSSQSSRVSSTASSSSSSKPTSAAPSPSSLGSNEPFTDTSNAKSLSVGGSWALAAATLGALLTK
ncbi:hypothetical protein IWQ60_008032 [Tieghemiomyces parasiticus]|uniref:Uncharacterized protein n=1 Tax=Tieghemiomyces parasiticus TaxID=78921 RepID=A0A9W8A0N3_9FUNG|nr:hypothetical protein IWQ60_008032 [Tieghemiomyces parasiticus]